MNPQPRSRAHDSTQSRGSAATKSPQGCPHGRPGTPASSDGLSVISGRTRGVAALYRRQTLAACPSGVNRRTLIGCAGPAPPTSPGLRTSPYAWHSAPPTAWHSRSSTSSAVAIAGAPFLRGAQAILVLLGRRRLFAVAVVGQRPVPPGSDDRRRRSPSTRAGACPACR